MSIELSALVLGETIIDQYNFTEAVGKWKEPKIVLRDTKREYLGGAIAIATNLAQFCKRLSVNNVGKMQNLLKKKKNTKKYLNKFY